MATDDALDPRQAESLTADFELEDGDHGTTGPKTALTPCRAKGNVLRHPDVKSYQLQASSMQLGHEVARLAWERAGKFASKVCCTACSTPNILRHPTNRPSIHREVCWRCTTEVVSMPTWHRDGVRAFVHG